MTLFEECLLCLSHYELINQNKCKDILSVLHLTNYGKIDVNSYRFSRSLEFKEFLKYDKKVECYVIYSDPEIPVIKTNLSEIKSNIDDVLSVAFDTWILLDDYSLIFEFYHDGMITEVYI